MFFAVFLLYRGRAFRCWKFPDFRRINNESGEMFGNFLGYPRFIEPRAEGRPHLVERRGAPFWKWRRLTHQAAAAGRGTGVKKFCVGGNDRAGRFEVTNSSCVDSQPCTRRRSRFFLLQGWFTAALDGVIFQNKFTFSFSMTATGRFNFDCFLLVGNVCKPIGISSSFFCFQRSIVCRPIFQSYSDVLGDCILENRNRKEQFSVRRKIF